MLDTLLAAKACSPEISWIKIDQTKVKKISYSSISVFGIIKHLVLVPYK